MKTYSIIFYISIILGMFFISGCQATPEREAVVNKQDRTAALYETQASKETTPYHLQYADEFTSTDDSVQFYLSIDQLFEPEKIQCLRKNKHSLYSNKISDFYKIFLRLISPRLVSVFTLPSNVISHFLQSNVAR